MYEHILIPTDGSKGANRGVTVGLDLARKYGSTVHTLYVVDERIYGETPALSDTELVMDSLESRGEQAMAKICERAAAAQLEAVSDCRRGKPHEEILRYADEHDVDLIVMGRHGESAYGAPHLGSVTHRLLRTSEIPVFPV